MNLSKKPLNIGMWISTVWLAVLPMAAGAMPADRNEPIYIQSDRAELDDRKGITIYEGEVQMEQGSLRITADKVTVHSVGSKPTRVIATGSPAHFQQKPAADKSLVVAEGTTIEYLVDKEKLFLIEGASIEQEGTTMTGERIDYNIKESVVTAVGDPSKTERIRIVIPPQAQNPAAKNKTQKE